MFNDLAFRDEMGLAGINSINWARILPQSVYYFTAATSIAREAVNFAVPTGNFGDVYAGYAAKAMGCPVGQLIVATNVNDILARTLATGRYETASVIPTLSPAMDIQLASNFERLVFDLSGRDPMVVRGMMDQLAGAGAFALTPDQLGRARQSFSARRIDEDETLATMRRIRRDTGQLIDPHSAVGVAAANHRRAEGLVGPIVCLATAHPAKFPEAVEQATGESPLLPPHLADLHQRQEHVTTLPASLPKLKEFITAHRGQS
jgi:threonine synthase